MAGIKLAELRRQELSEQIEALVSKGDVAAIKSAPTEVLLECARRYLANQIAVKQRSKSRAREQFVKVKEEANSRLRSRAQSIVEQFATEMHEQWSASLLAGDFSLPSGGRVTWGEATVAQHESRARHLESLAAGDMQTAAIHRSAIRDIRAAGVESLSAVVA